MKKQILILTICLFIPSLSNAEKQFTPWNHNAIIIAYDLKDATVSSFESMAQDEVMLDLFSAISTKSAPIIVSSSVFYTFLKMRKRWNDDILSNKEGLENKFLSFTQERNKILQKIAAMPKDRWGSASVEAQAQIEKLFKETMGGVTGSIRTITDTGTSVVEGLTPTYYAMKSLYAYIPFDDSTWDIYIAPTGNDWVVLVPTEYRRSLHKKLNNMKVEEYLKNLQAQHTASEQSEHKNEARFIERLSALFKLKDDEVVLGLRLTHFKKQSLTSLLSNIDAAIQPNTEVSISKLTPLFTPNTSHIATGNWSIYLTGHGLGSNDPLVQEGAKLNAKQIEYYREHINFLKNIIKEGANTGFPEEEIKIINEELQRIDTSLSLEYVGPLEETIETLDKKDEVFSKALVMVQKKLDKLYEQRKKTIASSELDPSAFIAGMSVKSFQTFLDFLDKDLSVNLLLYSTCFGGGYHLSRPYFQLIQSLDSKMKISLDKELTKSPIHFTLMSTATTDVSVATAASLMLEDDFFGKNITDVFAAINQGWPLFVPMSVKSPISFVRCPVDFKGMFTVMNQLAVKEESDPTIKNPWEKLTFFLSATSVTAKRSSEDALTYIPSVRFPGTDFFQVVGLQKYVDILNYARVEAKTYDFAKDKKPLILNKKAALVYVPVIEVPVVIQSLAGVFPKIISMAPGVGLHYVDQITADATTFGEFLKQTLFFEDAFNIYTVPKMFVIKNLILKKAEKTEKYSNVLVFMWAVRGEVNKSKIIAWDSEGNQLEGNFYDNVKKSESPKTPEVAINELLNDWLVEAKIYPQLNLGAPFQTDPEYLVAQVKKQLFKKTK